MPLIWVLLVLKRDLTARMAEPAARGLPWRGGSVSHSAELRSSLCTGPGAVGISSSLLRCAGYTRPIGGPIRACQLEVHSHRHLWQAGSSTLAVLSPVH